MNRAYFEDALRRWTTDKTPTAGLENAQVKLTRTGRKARCSIKIGGLSGDTVRVHLFTKNGYSLKSQKFPIATALGEQTFEVDFAEQGGRAHHLRLEVLTDDEKTGHLLRQVP